MVREGMVVQSAVVRETVDMYRLIRYSVELSLVAPRMEKCQMSIVGCTLARDQATAGLAHVWNKLEPQSYKPQLSAPISCSLIAQCTMHVAGRVHGYLCRSAASSRYPHATSNLNPQDS